MIRRQIRRIRNAGKRIRARFNRRPLILLYHRIGDATRDPWLLAVTERHFREHLEVIRQRGTPIGLRDVGASRRQPLRPIAITFDDCYGETMRTARRLLEACGMTATAFAPTKLLSSRREFWWDELERLLLDPAVTGTIELTIVGERVRCELASGSDEDAAWRAWELPSTSREAAYVDLYNRLLPLRAEEQGAILDELRVRLGVPGGSRVDYLPLSEEAVVELAGSGTIAVGAHTRSHAMLAALPPAEQRNEIEGSKRDLERVLGKEVDSFAYPYGNVTHYSRETVGLVQEAGFARACSNFTGLAAENGGSFELPRWTVPDCGGEEFERLLASAWSQ